VNLTELQKTLEAQGLEVVENQKEGVVGRKGLSDKTKGISPPFPSCISYPINLFRIQETTRRRETECREGIAQVLVCLMFTPSHFIYI